MIDERYIELMNQEIDGVNSAEESRALREVLKTSPEAKRYYEELLRLGEAFGEMDALDPPPGMRSAILSGIEAKGRPGVVKADSMSWFESFRSLLSPRVAYSFAAGLVLGIGLYAVLSNVLSPGVPGDREALVGAMVETDSGVTAEPLVIDGPEVSGSLLVRYSDDLILALLELSGEKETRVVVECTDARFEGYRLLDGADHSVRAAGDRVELLYTGHHKVLITFRDSLRSHPAVHIQAFSAGKPLFEGDVRVE